MAITIESFFLRESIRLMTTSVYCAGVISLVATRGVCKFTGLLTGTATPNGSTVTVFGASRCFCVNEGVCYIYSISNLMLYIQ